MFDFLSVEEKQLCVDLYKEKTIFNVHTDSEIIQWKIGKELYERYHNSQFDDPTVRDLVHT